MRRLGLPSKTPDNSSLPASHGHTPSGEAASKPKGKLHKGSYWVLHPNPTSSSTYEQSTVRTAPPTLSSLAQSACERYDRIELHEIKPEVTGVVLNGGVCPPTVREPTAD
jgi:transposase